MTRKIMAAMVLAGTFATARLEAVAETRPDYATERAQRAGRLTAPYGWFSLIALDWLKPGATTVGSAKENSVVLPGAPAHLLTLAQTGGSVSATAAASGVKIGANRSSSARLSARTKRKAPPSSQAPCACG